MKTQAHLLFVIVAAALTACGGGGGGSGGGGANVAAPSNLAYPSAPAILLVNAPAAANIPTVHGTVDHFTVQPSLPAGLTLDAHSGRITGTPSLSAQLARYTVRAENDAGSTSFELMLSVVEPARFAYVVSEGDSTISSFTVDATTGKLQRHGYLAAAATELNPEHMTIDPSGRFAYVTNLGTDNVSVYTIDPATGDLSARAPASTGVGPHALAIEPSGRFAYVANRGDDSLRVYAINSSTGALSDVGVPLATGVQPSALAIDATGRWLFLALRGEDQFGAGSALQVYGIDPQTGELEQLGAPQMLNGARPIGISIDPTKSTLYVLLETFESLLPVHYNAASGALTLVPADLTGDEPAGVSVHPTGKYAYVVNASGNTLSTFSVDAATSQLSTVGTIPTGARPACVVVDPLGRYAYVVSHDSQELTQYVIDQQTGALSANDDLLVRSGPAHMVIAQGPTPVAWTPRFVHTANAQSDDVSLFTIDATSGALTWVGPDAPAGDAPISISIDERHQRAYVANEFSHDISIFTIDAQTGALTANPTTQAVIGNPMSTAVDPSGRFLYVVARDVIFTDDGWVTSFAINAGDGSLTQIDTQEVGVHPTRVAVDPTGAFMYVANNGTGDPGTSGIMIFKLATDSGLPTVSAPTAAAPGVFNLSFHPSGKYAYGTLRDSNVLLQYTVNRYSGALALGTTLRAGLEPRATVISADGRFGYTAFYNSLGTGHVAFFELDANGSFSTGAELFVDGSHPSDLQIDPSGRFLYVSNAGSNSVSVMLLDPLTGRPTIKLPATSGLEPNALAVTGQLH